MLTYYCPNCWTIVEENQKVCPNCGYSLADFAHFDFDDKLIAALHHPVTERRIMAAQVLGNRQCKRALPEFRKILESDESNYFFFESNLTGSIKNRRSRTRRDFKKSGKTQVKIDFSIGC